MEKCVKVELHYGELLDLFVDRIRELQDLPCAPPASFTTACDAFKHDWRQRFLVAGPAGTSPRTIVRPVVAAPPRALASLVAFYITHRVFTPDPNPVDFADQLIAEHRPGIPDQTDPEIAALIADVRAAANSEGFAVYHAAASPAVPMSPEPLVLRLAALSAAGVLTALIVDSAVWPGPGNNGAASAVEQVIRSADWIGPVLLPTIDVTEGRVDVDIILSERRLPPRLVALPRASDARIALLSQTFLAIRPRVLLHAAGDLMASAERVPLLKSTAVKPG